MARLTYIGCVYLKQWFFLISWISLVIYLFYNTFIYYYNGQQFYYLRQILGVGLCLSRGTATVLNVCCAIILLPLCKKLNQQLYRLFSKLCPGLFFLWLEKAKSFHMTVAITLVVFGVTHSVSHFVNLWNFSRNYDEERIEINLATYKNENPLNLLMSLPGMSGLSMLLIILCMGVTSMRVVRRRLYNAFWYTHHLYLPFMALLMIHPISGVLKEEILEDSSIGNSLYSNNDTILYYVPQFRAIKPKTWLWMALPLACYFVDLFWRILTRNLSKVDIVKVRHMPGRTISLSLQCHQNFSCRIGQYILVQCADVSMIEWHPFTVVKIPCIERVCEVWIKVTGDWTEALEKLLVEREHDKISVLIDGPFSSPMERVCKSEIAICVAAGVGITPFVAMLDNLYRNPRSRNPGRIHLIWIVRTEREIYKLVVLADKCMSGLRNANRPDRLHLEIYVTGTKRKPITHTIQINNNGDLTHILRRDGLCEDEKSLLTPKHKRHTLIDVKVVKGDCHLLTRNIGIQMSGVDVKIDGRCDIVKDYPLVACRIKRGRPYWDKVFGYWVHLYPGRDINLFCCGPKNLVKLLRNKCKNTSLNTKTKLAFIHEAFS